MAKTILYYLPLLFLFAPSFTSPHFTAKNKQKEFTNEQFQIQDWVIDEQTANKMIDYFKNCKGKCHVSKKQVRNSKVQQYMQDNYTILSMQPITARYTDDDAARYKKNRNLPEDDERGKISGYTTVITKYKVVAKQGSIFPVVVTMFVDDCNICPPPEVPGCQ